MAKGSLAAGHRRPTAVGNCPPLHPTSCPLRLQTHPSPRSSSSSFPRCRRLTPPPAPQVVNNTIADELYVLYQCGAGAPPRGAFPEGTGFFQVPLTSISAPETVPYAFLVSRTGGRGCGWLQSREGCRMAGCWRGRGGGHGPEATCPCSCSCRRRCQPCRASHGRACACACPPSLAPPDPLLIPTPHPHNHCCRSTWGSPTGCTTCRHTSPPPAARRCCSARSAPHQTSWHSGREGAWLAGWLAGWMAGWAGCSTSCSGWQGFRPKPLH